MTKRKVMFAVCMEFFLHRKRRQLTLRAPLDPTAATRVPQHRSHMMVTSRKKKTLALLLALATSLSARLTVDGVSSEGRTERMRKILEAKREKKFRKWKKKKGEKASSIAGLMLFFCGKPSPNKFYTIFRRLDRFFVANDNYSTTDMEIGDLSKDNRLTA